MGALADARARQIAAKGRVMHLSRTGIAPVALQGFSRGFRPDELAGGIQQGDMRVEIGIAELLAAAFPVPPMRPDRLQVDGRPYAILGAPPLHEGEALIGYTLWVRGGQA